MYAWLVLVTCLCWRSAAGPETARFTPKARAARAYRDRAWPPWCYISSAGPGHAGDAHAGRSGRAARLFRLVEAMAGGSSGRRRAGRPWVAHYFDHPPEFLSGPLPIRFLLGTPIGFIGGNFAVLAALVLLIAWGVVRRRVRQLWVRPRGGVARPARHTGRTTSLLESRLQPVRMRGFRLKAGLQRGNASALESRLQPVRMRGFRLKAGLQRRPAETLGRAAGGDPPSGRSPGPTGAVRSRRRAMAGARSCSSG